jgi:hypothetical protein
MAEDLPSQQEVVAIAENGARTVAWRPVDPREPDQAEENRELHNTAY